MSNVDRAWLRMDSPRNPMVIIGLFAFAEPLAFGQLSRLFAQRLLRFDRFRQRVEEDVTGHWWVDDPTFRLSRHLKRVRLDDASEAALREHVDRFAARPLELSRPLWEMHFVERPGAPPALAVRIHHCIADGVALVRVMLALAADPPPPARARRRAGAAPTDESAWQGWLDAAAGAARSSLWLGGEVWTESKRTLGEPGRALDLAQAGIRVVADAAAILAMTSDTSTSLKGEPCGVKAFAWNDPLPLDELKPVCRALGASLNDVVLACVTGALRRYLLQRGDALAGDAEFRAMVPVNLRDPRSEPVLGNCFGLAPLVLPIGIESPIERVHEIRARMRELREGFQPALAFLLLAVLGPLPAGLQSVVLGYLAGKASAVMTNLPGPAAPVQLAGARVGRMLFWVPQSGDIGVGIAILSYAGAVQFSIRVDTALCPDPQSIVDGFAPEFERLVMTLAMLPNGVLAGERPVPGEVEYMLGLEWA
ncbi:MAG: wax ester/triacylglycerol synthase family O-acyltransferase [Burkholderiaceae bacterium]|nr:wax ester/triacylglycerol synthase family O-acyltransferase [Burkholderiaceae bacterium]